MQQKQSSVFCFCNKNKNHQTITEHKCAQVTMSGRDVIKIENILVCKSLFCSHLCLLNSQADKLACWAAALSFLGFVEAQVAASKHTQQSQKHQVHHSRLRSEVKPQKQNAKCSCWVLPTVHLPRHPARRLSARSDSLPVQTSPFTLSRTHHIQFTHGQSRRWR